jgi:hypothetical protein
VFGNPEFFRYNVQGTLHPLRILIALLMRLWQAVGYMNLFALTVAALLAMWRPPVTHSAGEGGTAGARPALRLRITLDIQFAFLVVAVVYMLAMSVLGGAVLARYMLPIVPLVIIVWVSTLWRRVPMWRYVIGIVVLGLVASLFINPPYGFSFEDNLAYRDYVRLHINAERFVEARYPMARVLTAWPANDELAQPMLGYVTRPMQTLRIESFSVQDLMSAAEMGSKFEVALVFSTKYQPPRAWLENWPAWQRLKERFFGYHRDVPPEVAAQLLGGEVVFHESRNGQWVGVIEIQKVVDANGVLRRDGEDARLAAAGTADVTRTLSDRSGF